MVVAVAVAVAVEGGRRSISGNERDVADYVPRAHGGLRSSASASVDGGGSGGYEIAASRVSSAAEDKADAYISPGLFGLGPGKFSQRGVTTTRLILRQD